MEKARYLPSSKDHWTGRISDKQYYLHEKVTHLPIEDCEKNKSRAIALLGYACDSGVKRNLGRPGAKNGPDAFRKELGRMPNALPENIGIIDYGTVQDPDLDMEGAQNLLATHVKQLLSSNHFPLLIGGGHDMAYGHYQGIRASLPPTTSLGIINLDAHFDLRIPQKLPNSGTPFYQIAQKCNSAGVDFKYLCLGVRKDANPKILWETASDLGTEYIERSEFNFSNRKAVALTVNAFMKKTDYVYLTIDLDGFSSAYAPGVSAASPMGFSPDIAMYVMNLIIRSKKLISLDIAELNSDYDRDNQTAKLAASLAHYAIHHPELF